MMSELHSPPQSAPGWMRRWLLAAAVYNLVWGAITILAPIRSLTLLGVSAKTTELWPQLWACIGMIVGVYGVGYAIASRDPLRHWPIVLVGLLGKILGPIGFVDAAHRGQLPWSMGLTIFTNDLLWWAPFGMILWHAFRSAQDSPAPEGLPLAHAMARVQDSNGRTLRELTEERLTLVVLLRHSGCTFCRETLADLGSREDAIAAAGVNIAVVGMSPAVELEALAQKYGLRTAACFADPDRCVYRSLQLGRGTFTQLFGPRVWWRGLAAAKYGIGKLEGDGFQMPGAFIIHRVRVVREYRHATVADKPDYTELACPALN
ncbi:MAG: AhpC/TSA family protein [Planctomycetes bacterium]|nr:AhpC/TSA family protein [Planctomycetota bacterium]